MTDKDLTPEKLLPLPGDSGPTEEQAAKEAMEQEARQLREQMRKVWSSNG